MMKKTLFFLGVVAVIVACNPNEPTVPTENPTPQDTTRQDTTVVIPSGDTLKVEHLMLETSVECFCQDSIPFHPVKEGNYSIETADSCIAIPDSKGLGVVARLVGKTEFYVTDDKGHTDTIAVTVNPRVTVFADILPLLGANKTELKSKMGEPLKETTDNIYYKLSEDGIAYVAYRFDNGKVSRIYAYPETYFAEFYDYLNERYFIEVVDNNTANYYNHFDLNRATLKIHFALNTTFGDPFWFAEYSIFDPANPYGL